MTVYPCPANGEWWHYGRTPKTVLMGERGKDEVRRVSVKVEAPRDYSGAPGRGRAIVAVRSRIFLSLSEKEG